MNKSTLAKVKSWVPAQVKKPYWQLASTYRLMRSVRRFLAHRMTSEQAKAEVKKALAEREIAFLEIVRKEVFDNPKSPYNKLFNYVGCNFADLQSRVRRHGLEPTFEQLAKEGFYLTPDEFKGRKDVVRGGLSFRVQPEDLRPVNRGSGFRTQSSGTSGRPTQEFSSLDNRQLTTATYAAFYEAHKASSYSIAVYDAVLPSSTAITNLFTLRALNIPVDRWFARWTPSRTRRAGWSSVAKTHLIVACSNALGARLPRPEFVGVDEMHRIVAWILEKRRHGEKCWIRTAASNAVRIAQFASDQGVSLDGTKFNVSGEPFTEAKRNILQRVGATATPAYGAGGAAGRIGFGCGRPIHTDDVHVAEHTYAIVAHSRAMAVNSSSIQPLLFTTVFPRFSRLLINAELGDYAVQERRQCGCAMGEVGLSLHLHNIRSYEKFTSAGMNYFYGDLFDSFEKNFPSEFGGSPGDYQLVEAEDAGGQTTLTLRVHPRIGEVDERTLLKRLQEELSRQSWTHEFQARIWQNAGILRVSRDVPYESARGKILPLHIDRTDRQRNGREA